MLGTQVWFTHWLLVPQLTPLATRTLLPELSAKLVQLSGLLFTPQKRTLQKLPPFIEAWFWQVVSPLTGKPSDARSRHWSR